MVTYIFAAIAIVALLSIFVSYRNSRIQKLHLQSNAVAARQRVGSRRTISPITDNTPLPYNNIHIEGLEVTEISNTHSLWHTLSAEQQRTINSILSDFYVGVVPLDESKKRFGAVCRPPTT